MNSFSYDLKREIANIIPDGQDEAISELSALIKTSGEIHKSGKKYSVVIKTEIAEICELVNLLVQKIYGKSATTIFLHDKIFSKDKYQIRLPENLTMQILQDTEILQLNEQHFYQISQEVSQYLVAEQNLAQSYLRGAFLGSFSCNINLTGESFQRRSTGYHIEFVFSNQEYAQNFCLFLADFDILSKMVERKGFFVVYIKGLDMISDLLVLSGANKGVLALQNESAMRSIRNNVNRQINCISANLTKTVDASVREMDAIDTIMQTIGIDSLEKNLKDVCYLRIANSEENLDNLAKLLNPPTSKSTIYRRLKKIEKIASELKK